jgi:hypothetical protein
MEAWRIIALTTAGISLVISLVCLIVIIMCLRRYIMAGHVSNDAIIDRYEKRYGFKGIESNAIGLYYMYSDDDDRLAIITCANGKHEAILLEKRQAEALIEEIKGVCELAFGW